MRPGQKHNCSVQVSVVEVIPILLRRHLFVFVIKRDANERSAGDHILHSARNPLYLIVYTSYRQVDQASSIEGLENVA